MSQYHNIIRSFKNTKQCDKYLLKSAILTRISRYSPYNEVNNLVQYYFDKQKPKGKFLINNFIINKIYLYSSDK